MVRRPALSAASPVIPDPQNGSSTSPSAWVLAKMKGAGIPCLRIGTTGGEAIAISGETAVSVEALKTGFEAWLPAYMSGKA